MSGGYSFLLGLDLGQAADYSALTVVELPIWRPAAATWVSPSELDARRVGEYIHTQGELPLETPLNVRQLHRYPIHMPYPEIVRHVAGVMQSSAIRDKGVALLVDATGVGRPVCDLFREAGLRPIAITITGGNQAHRDRITGEWTVPKRDLVSALQVALQSGQLRISPKLEHAKTFLEEAKNFRVSISLSTGHDSYGAWRESIHDDLILATSLPVWFYARRIRGRQPRRTAA